MSRAIVIGQSHCNAIAQALEVGEHDPIAISIYRTGIQHSPDEEPFTFSAAIKLVEKLPENTPVFVSALGAYHNQLGLLESGKPFDFLLDRGDIAEPPPVMRVPNRAVARAFCAVFEDTTKINKLKSVSKSAVYILSTPPPKQDNAFIKSRLMAQKKKVYNGRSLLEFDVERPEIRLKLWRLETRLLEQWSLRGGMRFVPAPSEAFDEAGFLRPIFYDDATHANARYGALVVNQIRAILARAGADG